VAVLAVAGVNEKAEKVTASGKTEKQATKKEEPKKDIFALNEEVKLGNHVLTVTKFESSHFPEATNPIAHLRVNHRDDVNGTPTLFIEEFQSDWGQKGKKHGFSKQETIPEIDAGDLLAKYGDKLNVDQKNWLQKFGGRWDAMMDDVNRGAKPESAIDDLHKEYSNWISKQKIGIEAGPYVQDTKDWTALALKQAIKEAVDNGKTQVAWTTGAQQAERYDLSKHLSSVSLRPHETKEGIFRLSAKDLNGNNVLSEHVLEDQIEDHIGKDLAKKLIEQKPLHAPGLTKDELEEFSRLHNFREKGTISDKGKARLEELRQKDNDSLYHGKKTIEGLDIKVGGEGMKGYYDEILPQVANDVIKQLGGKNKVKVIDFEKPVKDPNYKVVENTGEYGNPATRKYMVINKDDDTLVATGMTPEEALEQARSTSYHRHLTNQHEGSPKKQLGFEITPEMIKFIKEDAGIPKFKKGGPVNLQQEYKLENLRRRYG
jgi:hypothetical protein